MSVQSARVSGQKRMNWKELSQELAKLDLSRPATLGSQLVRLLARFFETDRVCLLLYSEQDESITNSFHTGHKVPAESWTPTSGVIRQVCTERRPLFVNDIHRKRGLVSQWSTTYKTDAFAVIPVVTQKQIDAVLCLSNLSTQQVDELQLSAADLELAMQQIRQVVRVISSSSQPGHSEGSVDELGIFAKLVELLDKSAHPRDLFSIFSEAISELIPVEVFSVIHDRIKEEPQGVVCVHRPALQTEVSELFDSMAQQWQRRHRNSPLLQITEARLVGQELLSTKRSAKHPPLGGWETFPIFLDNDLFAIVSIATRPDILANRRLLSAFNVLTHHLMLHVKTKLLLAQNSEMQTLDGLTGLYNERHFFETMEREFDRSARYNVPLTLLFVDIDHFKDINDTYGFETGDKVLKDISRIITENMRTTDFVSRYSGERFVTVLPETHYTNGEMMANRLRRYIENYSFYIPNTNVFIKVTASIGVASYLDHKPASVAQFIEFADAALYFAKRNGRNQVVGYSYVINLMCGDTRHKG